MQQFSHTPWSKTCWRAVCGYSATGGPGQWLLHERRPISLGERSWRCSGGVGLTDRRGRRNVMVEWDREDCRPVTT